MFTKDWKKLDLFLSSVIKMKETIQKTTTHTSKTADLPFSDDQFLLQLPDRLDIIHQANKSVFFECLTREVLDELKPKYE